MSNNARQREELFEISGDEDDEIVPRPVPEGLLILGLLDTGV